MPSGHDHVFERLEVAVNAWNLEIGQMRGALGAELEKLGRQLEGLTAMPAPGVDEADRLKTLVQDLEGQLEQALERVAALETQLKQNASNSTRFDSMSPEAVNQKLLEALRDRDEAHQEIVALRAEAELLRRANAHLSGPLLSGPLNNARADSPEGKEKSSGEDVDVFDADGHRRRIGQILLELGVINEAQLREALAEQTQNPRRRLGSILIEKGWASETVVARILACQLGLPYVDLADRVVDAAARQALPARLAARHECVPVAISPGKMILSMANPFDLAAIEEVELATSRRVDPVVSPLCQVRDALARYYGVQEPPTEA